MNGLASGIVLAVSLLVQTTPEAAPSDERFVLRTLKNPFGFEDCGFSPDGKRFVARHDNGLQFWDVGDDYRQLRQDDGGTICFAISPDSTTFLTGGGGPTVGFSDAQGKRLPRTITTEQHPQYSIVSALRFSPDGKQLAVGMSRRVVLYDFASGTKLREFEPPFDRHCFAAQAVFLDHDRLLVRWETRDDGSVALTEFDLNTGKVEPRPFPTVPGVRRSFTLSPDGKSLALYTAQGLPEQDDDWRKIVLMDVATEQVRWSVDGGAIAPAFSANGKWLVVNGGLREGEKTAAVARVLNVESGKLVRVLNQTRRYTGTNAFVTGLAFSPDGKTLATCSSNLPVTLWDWTKIEAELPK